MTYDDNLVLLLDTDNRYLSQSDKITTSYRIGRAGYMSGPMFITITTKIHYGTVHEHSFIPLNDIPVPLDDEKYVIYTEGFVDNVTPPQIEILHEIEKYRVMVRPMRNPDGPPRMIERSSFCPVIIDRNFHDILCEMRLRGEWPND